MGHALGRGVGAWADEDGRKKLKPPPAIAGRAGFGTFDGLQFTPARIGARAKFCTMQIQQFLDLLHGVKKSGKGWTAKCPAHGDGTASLSISNGDDRRTLLHCHAGCTPDAICSALGLKTSDLFTGNGTPQRLSTRIVATYLYHDAAGKVLFEVVRYHPKDFRQRKPDTTAPDGWTWNTKGIKKVLFRLPEILAAIPAANSFSFVKAKRTCSQWCNADSRQRAIPAARASGRTVTRKPYAARTL